MDVHPACPAPYIMVPSDKGLKLEMSVFESLTVAWSVLVSGGETRRINSSRSETVNRVVSSLTTCVARGVFKTRYGEMTK